MEQLLSILPNLTFNLVTKKPIEYKLFNGIIDDMPAFSYIIHSGLDTLIETFTSDGKETENIAKNNDVIICGPSLEKYVLLNNKFIQKYEINNGIAIPEQSPRTVAEYLGEEEIYFTASWGEQMVLKNRDFLVKDGDHYYRIARKEYLETYNLPE